MAQLPAGSVGSGKEITIAQLSPAPIFLLINDNEGMDDFFYNAAGVPDDLKQIDSDG